ncbi:MAG TPA: MurR/RpiR family transcriptional regulator [Anaerolineae bacterium]|nr:MurR/RpiR family transcriptional regulator [Anaerolineae bacterium]HQK15183.1 MurR/RpiR family transcriptional regulator [Anaerolineae bacterium]
MFQDRIRENYENLTPGFRKLADFIMNSTLDAAFLTATELSRRVGVDPATVVRFAQELNYSGYRELSREIKHYVRDQVTSTYRRTGEAQATEELLQSLVENAAQNMQHFVTTDLPNVIQAVETIKAAPHIWITGEFTCYELAVFLAKKFKTYSIPASAFHPGMGETASILPQMNPDDVLIALVGVEPCLDTGYAVHMAREKGVKTIAITNSGVALPARESSLTIIVPSKTPTGIPTFGTLLQVIALIWEAVTKERASAEALEKLASFSANMEQLLKLRTETPEYEVTSPKDLWDDSLPQ